MRVLLAEDEKSLSRVLVTIFEKNHYSVDPVYNGEDALAYLQSDNYDVAVRHRRKIWSSSAFAWR